LNPARIGALVKNTASGGFFPAGCRKARRPRVFEEASSERGASLASIAFTAHLKAVGPTRPVACEGATLAEMLDAVAADYPRLKAYVLDDQGRLRTHIAIFIDGALVPRATALHRPLPKAAEVYVFQALSGG
jgi:hypothetical protein